MRSLLTGGIPLWLLVALALALNAVSCGESPAPGSPAPPPPPTAAPPPPAAAEPTEVRLSVSRASVAEDAGATELQVTGTLVGGTRTAATEITLRVVAGTADAADFAATDAVLTIPAGEASGAAGVVVTPVHDAIAEPNETIRVEGTAAGLTVVGAEVAIVDAPQVTEVGDGISTTSDGRILLELERADGYPPNPFDLDGKTLVFTPDGSGGYVRSVRSVVWAEDIGRTVADGEEIELGFRFDFSGQRWSSFFVSRHGLVTFGEPLAFRYGNAANSFDTMSRIAQKFVVTTPAISTLYKPLLGGRFGTQGATQHVAKVADQVVVTWITTEGDYYVYGVPPARFLRLQLVLTADGTIAINYGDVALGDGIVGLFPNEVRKGTLIATIPDATNRDLPGHLDLLEVAIYESNTDDVIVEFTTRSPIPDPGEGAHFSYRLYFDTDKPFWREPSWGPDGDEDFSWFIDVHAGGDFRAWGRGVSGLMATDAGNRIALLADLGEVGGVSAAGIPDAAHFADGSYVEGNGVGPVTVITLPEAQPAIDLSRPDRPSSRQAEVFHYRGVPDTADLACRVVEALGDEFDLLVFHNEFRRDIQESSTPWERYNEDIQGIGDDLINRASIPCGEGRLKGHWTLPVWMKSDHVFLDS